MTIKNAVFNECGKHASMILRALDANKIDDWSQLKSVDKLKGIKKYIETNSNSGRTYISKLASVLGSYEDEVGGYAKKWRDLLRIEDIPSQQTYFSLDDLKKWAGVETKNDMERVVVISGLIEARTGARISDTKDLDELNVVEGMLTYISKKTKNKAAIPSSDELLSLLKLRSSLAKHEICDVYYNKQIKILAERAGIDYDIKLNQMGEQKTAKKCSFLTSHDFRHGFCTNLHLAGEELLTISRMAGHSGTSMTERYIVTSRRPNAERYDYFERLDAIIREKFFA